MRSRRESSAPGPGAPAGGEVRISVLGDLTATRDGAAVDLGGRRQRAVLGLLILAQGDVVPADRLIDSLWSGQPPPRAVGALQSYVSHLRRRLEPERTARSRASVIASVGPGYALRVSGDAVDAWLFERLVREAAAGPDSAATLVRALALWRGPAWADYADEPWAEAEVARLTELREVAREQLAAARLARGETAVVVPELEALVARQPLREERWRLLVLALYRSHRQADALAALRRARQVLADELGIDPGPSLRALEAEVLAQSPALQPPSQPPRPAPDRPGPYGPGSDRPAPVRPMSDRPGPDGPDPDRPGPDRSAPDRSAFDRAGVPARPSRREAPLAGLPADGLVDRAGELAELRACVAEALDGQARLVLVEGPAGIGKTRLLAEARRLAAEHGAQLFTARGSQLEKEFGFGAVRQLFEPMVATAPEGRDALAGAAASAAVVFDVVTEGRRTDGSLAILHGLYWLTVNICAGGPILLAIDDLQWCDSASLRFLCYLVRRVEGMPVLIVATLRTGEPHEDEALLDELARDPITVPIRPAPLSAAGVADLVRGRLGAAAEDEFVAACHRTTSGNPLLVRQLLRALQTEGVRPDAAHADTVTAIGSRAISSLVLMRLTRLPAASTAVARSIAVLGNGAALPTVATLADLSESAAATAIAVLARAEVLRDEYPLSFVHPLVADAVYRALPPGERQLHHDRAARVLHQAGASHEQVAAHLLQVPQRGDPWVVDVLRHAADRAAARGAPDAAARYLARALREPPDPATKGTVLLELGQSEVLGDGYAAVGHLREAYQTITDQRQLAVVAQTLARALVFAGAAGEATRFARSAAARLPADLADDRQGLLGLERIGGYMHDLDPSEWRDGEEPAVVGDGPGARMLAAALAWESLIDGTDRARAVELARFANADGVLMDVDTGLLWVVAAIVVQMADEDSRPQWDAGLAHSHERGAVFGALATHLWRGYLEWECGDLREAYQCLLTSSEQTEAWGMNFGSAYADAFMVATLIDRGRVAEARALLEQVRPLARFAEGARLFGDAEARVLLAEGRFAQALASLDEVLPLMTSVRNPVWRPWRSLRAQALAGLGRSAEAIALVEEELRLAQQWGAPSLIGRTLRLLGELRGPEGVAQLREAVAVLGPGRARLEHARALSALAGHLPPDEAAPLLIQAAELAWHCGADGLHQRILAELDRIGVAAPALPPPVLSRTEREVLVRHVAGASERDIAEALFLTPRSVAATLDDVRHRLGTSSRDELARELDRP